MHTIKPKEIEEIMEAEYYRPAISVIMPFNPKMGHKTELKHTLKTVSNEVKRELLKSYPGEITTVLMNKMGQIIEDLNFNTHKKSIAIYLSPVFQKVIYLDIPVETKVMVDETFEIRDLVYSKKQLHKYLVLVLSEKQSQIFLGNAESFIRLVSNEPGSVNAYINDAPERVANFTDAQKRSEIIMDKFLGHIDNGLDIILHAYPLPLFVIGTKKIMGHFKKITKHKGAVIEYIHGNYDEADTQKLRTALEPHIANWKKVIETDILNQMEEAANKKKLASGIKAVWKESMNKKGRLLIVEKNFMYPTERSQDSIIKVIEPYNKFSYIKDAVDEIIEKVLENGGDVEFVDNDLLKDHNRIALIQHY